MPRDKAILIRNGAKAVTVEIIKPYSTIGKNDYPNKYTAARSGEYSVA